MKNIRICYKLVGGFLVVSLISVVMGLFNINSMDRLSRNFVSIESVSLPLASHLARMSIDLNNVRTAVRTLLDENIPNDVREQQNELLATARTKYGEVVDAIDKLQVSEKDRGTLGELKKNVAAWRESNSEVLTLIAAKDFAKARSLAYGENRAIQQKTLRGIDELLASQKGESARIASEVSEESKSASMRSTVLMFCAFLVSIGLGLTLTVGISRPLRKAVGMADGLARGDLSVRMSLARKDEVGMLAGSLDAMADTVSRLNAGIVETANRAMSGHLRASIDHDGFSGEFGKLIISINRWVGSMLHLIDRVPSPIMIRDANRNIRFLNAGGSLGAVDVANLDGLKCETHFKTEDCANGRCACDLALKSRKEEASTTVARPLPGVELDIEYKAIPFGDDAVFEFVTDHTQVMKIQRDIVGIAAKADQVAASVASAAEELSAQVEQSSRGAQEQAQRVGETATASEQMNATVLEVAKSASIAADTAAQAKHKAEDGAQVVSQVVQGIAEVQQNALALKTDMTSLGQQAQGIGQIINVISDIADQTNLLALNAAIEAARAGEAGRGFAVVADEVRKLAEKTMNATREVGEAIRGIQDGTQKNIAHVEQTVEKIGGATALATQSGDSLGEIVVLVEMTTDQVRSIATASEQQSSASEEINRSIDDINRISMETSTAMQQSAQAVTELANQSQVLNGLIEEMQSGHAPQGEAHPARAAGPGRRAEQRLALA
jgi:methyl-accepting chemotaxis protein